MLPRRGRDPVYRCPKGGFHKWGRRKLRWVIVGWFHPYAGRVQRINTRRCAKCGTMMGPEGPIV